MDLIDNYHSCFFLRDAICQVRQTALNRKGVVWRPCYRIGGILCSIFKIFERSVIKWHLKYDFLKTEIDETFMFLENMLSMFQVKYEQIVLLHFKSIWYTFVIWLLTIAGMYAELLTDENICRIKYHTCFSYFIRISLLVFYCRLAPDLLIPTRHIALFSAHLLISDSFI